MTSPLDVLDEIEQAYALERAQQSRRLAAAGWTPDPRRGVWARFRDWLRRKT